MPLAGPNPDVQSEHAKFQLPILRHTMGDASSDKRDFFVSFNQADRAWATWIAWVLEEAGYSVFFQDWDFRGSFVEQMHQASLRAGRTLVVLSDNYLRSEYARSEAWAALARDPVGREDRVVTVKVGPTGDLGLFAPLRLPRPHRQRRGRRRAPPPRAGEEVARPGLPRRSPRPARASPAAATRQVRDQPRFPARRPQPPAHQPGLRRPRGARSPSCAAC